MMKVFITGGDGFIGYEIVRKLLARGHHVTALVRSQESIARLSRSGAVVAQGDVINTASMRAAMIDCDVVMHVAGYAELGDPNRDRMDSVNVGGTRKVLGLAHELQIPRIIFTSSVEVFGDTHGRAVDETYVAQTPFLTEHARTKWLAHYEVALPLMQKGAPITIVMPGAIYGPGGQGLVMDMMRIFQRGYPFVAGADTVLTFAHVEDIAEGHVLALERGKIGETYILSGPAVSLGDMLDFWSYLTGQEGPRLRIPAALVRSAAPLLSAVGRVTGLKAAFSREGAQIAGATFIARSDKAREELGWRTRPLQDGMLETLNWVAATDAEQGLPARKNELMLGGAAFLAAGLLLAGWLLSRRDRA